MFTALSLVVTFLTLSPTCNAVVSFVEGCEPMDGQFYGTDKVGFYCMVADGTWFDYKYSMIDLGHCVANNNGQLVGYDEGFYQDTCDECALHSIRDGHEHSYRTCYLTCKCHNLNGVKVDSQLDLNDVLQNDDGRLVCFDNRGTRDSEPPECHQNEACSTGQRRLTPRATGFAAAQATGEAAVCSRAGAGKMAVEENGRL